MPCKFEFDDVQDNADEVEIITYDSLGGKANTKGI